MTIPASQQGFTLLEALITVVVVSLGLLGLLGLQAVTLASTQVSSARSTATVAADNIAERMRANPAGLNNNAYASITHPAGGAAPATDCSQAQCSPAELATYDTYQWDIHLGRILPAGRGRIECLDADTGDADPCSPNSPHVISVIWREADRVADRGGAGDKCAAFDDAGDNVTDRCFQTTFLP